MFVAPFSAEVGCGPVCGWTISSLVERTVVHAVGPGVSSGCALMAASSLEPAACCQTAGAAATGGARVDVAEGRPVLRAGGGEHVGHLRAGWASRSAPSAAAGRPG